MSLPVNTPWDQRLARIMVRPFKDTSLHPNHLTTVTLLLGQATAWTFALAMEGFAGLAALLYMLAVFSDHLDGELARMSGKASRFGHHFDYIVGGINYTSLFIGIGSGLYHIYGTWALVLGLAAGLSNPLNILLDLVSKSRILYT